MRITITPPKNTLPTAPVTISAPYPADRINKITIGIPSGHGFVTGIKVYAGNENFAVVPTAGSTDEWLIDDGKDVVTVFDPPLIIDMPSNRVRVVAYNKSVYYPHSFTVDVE